MLGAFIQINHIPIGPLALSPLAILLFLFVIAYIFVPIKFRRSQIKGLKQEYTPIEVPELPLEVSHAFQIATPILASLGFQAVGHVALHVARMRQDAYLSFWINRATGDVARIIGIKTPALPVPKITQVVIFWAEFSDRTRIGVTNSSYPSSFPADPKTRAIRCPDIWDITLLYRLHQAQLRHYAPDRKPTVEGFTDIVEVLQREHTETYGRLIQLGYFFLDAAKEQYVPTWKGTFLMTYRFLPPFRQIRKFMHARQTNSALQTLGFGSMKSLHRSQFLPPPLNAAGSV
jgi:hypothetical protein